MSVRDLLGRSLAHYLSRPRMDAAPLATSQPELLAATLVPGDVLLVEGNSRISAAIKYITQSSWSHAALYIGDSLALPNSDVGPYALIEADINQGIRAAPLSTYSRMHTRICRPVGLSKEKIEQVIAYMVSRLGYHYDLKNIFDLARYLIQTPPVPVRWRRRLLAFGSGDPTKTICSSLLAQAFQSVKYPILPEVTLEKSADPACVNCYTEILHIKHHSLFTPRDFDVSPYFQIVKPTIAQGFDPCTVKWTAEDERNLATPQSLSIVA